MIIFELNNVDIKIALECWLELEPEEKEEMLTSVLRCDKSEDQMLQNIGLNVKSLDSYSKSYMKSK